MTSTLKSTRELQSKQNKPSGGRSHASSSRAFSSPRASGESEPGTATSGASEVEGQPVEIRLLLRAPDLGRRGLREERGDGQPQHAEAVVLAYP
eukprot:CAMPEP_0177259352 /NCGR_PEP_ID=MMETSP0367-20130122/58601_1 /TAXON_ID=447022 ORGANISM="Scrippsiella hangoei-like, Strain SHHI-4" /NCGR_SAMPLE_ID=MMETSP0367 /ASSEMBLY_ACC=CAM_ASM_000362 /LENGTH=93 /DNA_ID=CAMNT_0018713641 /DNA_START=233 /DNA_END=512 /DNA_ORIENTATION=-